MATIRPIGIEDREQAERRGAHGRNAAGFSVSELCAADPMLLMVYVWWYHAQVA